jgi:hypothetical protein
VNLFRIYIEDSPLESSVGPSAHLRDLSLSNGKKPLKQPENSISDLSESKSNHREERLDGFLRDQSYRRRRQVFSKDYELDFTAF